MARKVHDDEKYMCGPGLPPPDFNHKYTCLYKSPPMHTVQHMYRIRQDAASRMPPPPSRATTELSFYEQRHHPTFNHHANHARHHSSIGVSKGTRSRFYILIHTYCSLLICSLLDVDRWASSSERMLIPAV